MPSKDKFIKKDKMTQKDSLIYYHVFVLEQELKEILAIPRNHVFLKPKNFTVTQESCILASHKVQKLLWMKEIF